MGSVCRLSLLRRLEVARIGIDAATAVGQQLAEPAHFVVVGPEYPAALHRPARACSQPRLALAPRMASLHLARRFRRESKSWRTRPTKVNSRTLSVPSMKRPSIWREAYATGRRRAAAGRIRRRLATGAVLSARAPGSRLAARPRAERRENRLPAGRTRQAAAVQPSRRKRREIEAFDDRRGTLRSGAENLGCAGPDNQAAIGRQGRCRENLQRAAGDGSAAAVGVRAAQGQRAAAQFSQSPRTGYCAANVTALPLALILSLPPLPVKVIDWLVENPAPATSVPPPRLNAPPLPCMLGTSKTPPIRLYVPLAPSENTLVTVFVPPIG